jgi:hypothetical protein
MLLAGVAAGAVVGVAARYRRVDAPAGALLHRLLAESECGPDLAGYGLGIPVGRRGQEAGAADGGEAAEGAEAEVYAVDGLAVGADGAVRLSSRKVSVGDRVSVGSSCDMLL